MASIVGLAAWVAALGPQTAGVDRIGQVVDVGIPGRMEDTNQVEESRMTLEDSHEAGNLAGLQDQNADSVEEGSRRESTAAVETSEDPADEVVVAGNAAAAVDYLAGSAVEFGRQVAAALADSELATLMQVCRSGEHSTRK